MDMHEYQNSTGDTAIYPGSGKVQMGMPSDHGVLYNALALAGEAGEIAGKASKVLRDREGVLDRALRLDLLRECGDVQWHLTQLIASLGGSLAVVAQDNLTKLEDRKSRGVLGGSGDTR